MARPIKILFRIVGSLLLVVCLSVLMLSFVGHRQANKRVDVDAWLTDVPGDSATITRGEHLARIYVCNDCHTGSYAGKVLVDAPPFRVVARNLTPGKGGMSDYSVADWDRAIRKGVAANGRQLAVMMPSDYFHALCDDDVEAMIAYFQSLAPIDNDLPATKFKFLGYVITAVSDGGLQVSTEKSRRPARNVVPGPTWSYGNYLAHISCIACHGEKLLGGEHADPEGPPGPSLGPIAAWTLDGFKRAMREGVTPAGKTLDAAWMPWNSYQQMTDTELEALYVYLKRLIVRG